MRKPTELPIPPNASAAPDDYTEALRVFIKSNGATTFDLSSTVLHTVPLERWSVIFGVMAHDLVTGVAQDKSDDISLAKAVYSLLTMAAESALDEIGLKPSDMDVEETAFGEHPGEIALPGDLYDNREAKQVLSLWMIPEHICPDCQEVHEREPSIGINSEPVSPKEFGIALAQAVIEFATEKFATALDTLKVQTEIEFAFHDHLSKGMVRA